MAKRKEHESKSANSKLFNEKITFDELKKHLWAAADILRGSVEPSVYRQPVMTLLFLKRLNDTFEENAEKHEQDGKSKKEAWEDRNKLRGEDIDRISLTFKKNSRR